VALPGTADLVQVRLGSIIPQTGQVVRIEGNIGDRFVADVMSPPELGGATGGVGIPRNLQSRGTPDGFTLTWDDDIGYGPYQVQIATDDTWAQVIRDFRTGGNYVVVNNLLMGTDYVVRVRQVNTGSGEGEWSEDITAVVSVPEDSDVDDGIIDAVDEVLKFSLGGSLVTDISGKESVQHLTTYGLLTVFLNEEGGSDSEIDILVDGVIVDSHTIPSGDQYAFKLISILLEPAPSHLQVQYTELGTDARVAVVKLYPRVRGSA
jgi:hypothetical protein